ncbi:hypothetical protein DYB37_000916 [Aphanomyces astaci]|uniref:Uncharacterized protein n=1 Tax=Aphanomyces astaci TaxID=112090 RepID=A0A3L6VMS0_APHAT|nr:hypothetical protein DYB35_000530 [Aphanomyces astaci]RHZ13825.1 hypothetical protein DYB37_000916 [Aphanomyces astaci]RLO10080.1 hypothetical protein DYB28_011639 [Aphanomyces astaci]
MPPSFPPSSTYTTNASKPHVLSHAKRKLVDPSKYMELPPVAGGRPASSRLLKPQVSSRLYPLETSLATDASVQKICLALVHAACVDDKLLLPSSSSTARPPMNGGGAASRVPLAPFTSPLKTAISPPSFHSPSVDALLCSEDMECTPQKGSGGNGMTGGEVDEDRRSELQEKAVLQEFSVWLRNLATASVNHVMQHSST